MDTQQPPKHDSNEWRLLRNHMLERWVEDPVAIQWVLDYFDVCELFDDLLDKDKAVSDARVQRALWEALVDMPGNPFFLANAATLIPVISTGVNAYLDANTLESEPVDANLHFSYVMRAVYIAALQAVVEITRGRDFMRSISVDIVRFFGSESYAQYKAKLMEGT